MDIFLFVVVIIGMAGILYLLMRWEKRTKQNFKDKASDLLLVSDPNPKEVKDTLKNLHLYAGRIRKDKEALRLIGELREKHGHLLTR